MKRQTGFTLIELLVVIAIIAILITIVIANVGSARGRAKVVAAKATLKQVQVQAELDGYECDGQVQALIDSAIAKVSGDAGDDNCTTSANGLAVDINEAFETGGFPDESFCVDTNGYSGAGTANDGLCEGDSGNGGNGINQINNNLNQLNQIN